MKRLKPQKPQSYPMLSDAAERQLYDFVAQACGSRDLALAASAAVVQRDVWGNDPPPVAPPVASQVVVLSASFIVGKVAGLGTGVNVAWIFGKTRTRNIIPWRHYSWYRLRVDLNWAYPKIARFFNRDHSTIQHGVKKVEGVLAKRGQVLAADFSPVQRQIWMLHQAWEATEGA